MAKNYEETREGLINKLNDELDELVSESVAGDKAVQAQLITANAPTIDNCIEIIFAISEYGDDLELTEADYDKLINSQHTLLALAERYTSSDFHTGDSEAIVNFLNNFVKSEDINNVSTYGRNEHEYVTERARIIKADKAGADQFEPLDFRELFPKTIAHAYTVENPAVDESLYKIKKKDSGDIIGYISADDNNLFLSRSKDTVNEQLYIKMVYKAVAKDVQVYNNSTPLPDKPFNESVSKQGYRIVDLCGDTVLAVKKQENGNVKYAVWEYDREDGGCVHGDYYLDVNGYQYARDKFLTRVARAERPIMHTLIDFQTLDTIVHGIDDSKFSYDDREAEILRLYDEYDRLKKISIRDFTDYYGDGYPITDKDADRLLMAPSCLTAGLEIYSARYSEEPLTKGEHFEYDESFDYIKLYIKTENRGLDFDTLKRQYLKPIDIFFETVSERENNFQEAVYQALIEQENNISPYITRKYTVADMDGVKVLLSDERLKEEDLPDFMCLYHLDDVDVISSRYLPSISSDKKPIVTDEPLMTLTDYIRYNIVSDNDLILTENNSSK
ncbi:MAG: hypothetical protein IJ740_05150 [Ruminococcus sp.]|nr:hypothetical protein [Ruminococcus sp.]